MQLVKLSILGFIAGFLAVLIFHQSPLATESAPRFNRGARAI